LQFDLRICVVTSSATALLRSKASIEEVEFGSHTWLKRLSVSGLFSVPAGSGTPIKDARCPHNPASWLTRAHSRSARPDNRPAGRSPKPLLDCDGKRTGGDGVRHELLEIVAEWIERFPCAVHAST
jgi:hypothetical protein